MNLFLADFLGNIFFAGTLAGGIGWVAIIAHMMGYITLPKRER